MWKKSDPVEATDDLAGRDVRSARTAIKGRGTTSYVPGRFAVTTSVEVDDGWGSLEPDAESPSRPKTVVKEENARSIISHNSSPDVGFSHSVNPYKGCEHGCVYCFARPSHAYLDLSPGLDFETRIFAKSNAAALLRAEIARPSYACSPIALGINTDAYQPAERRHCISRACLEVLADARHPVSFVTKAALIERDIDILTRLAQRNLVSVHFSVTTLDNRLAAKMEPRAAAPHARLRAMRALHEAGIPVGVLVAPVVPMISDRKLEHILEAAREHGARSAGYVLLRLPHELTQLWREWLELHYPDRAKHVMSLIQQMRGGKDYDSSFGKRMVGEGPFAQLIAQRFASAYRRLGFGRMPKLDTSQFRPPRPETPQMELF
ncbi:PA0069 family radical SAM protein [Xanthomonas theicola]|uniref:Radical SAM protein n=1 Tax=Xanthomonas theicola TaxID=56464 RepID=A0A2S6ZAR8_9XANT|nr:PA0069 family radical SAM protein [Xanthomonas theicola]PPT80177.1 radical SAM protein [Xanthomonas theicola]QNH26127.1 PA0069 family radical SAM protein [Xanthomonas theicola]